MSKEQAINEIEAGGLNFGCRSNTAQEIVVPTADSERTITEGQNVVASKSPFSSVKKSSAKRKRVLIDVHNNHNNANPVEDDESEEESENEYERQRMERIKRNQEKLRELGVQQMARELTRASNPASNRPAQPRPPRQQRQKQPKGTVRPTRQSSRVRNLSAEDGQPLPPPAPEPEAEPLLKLEDYFKSIDQDISTALHVEGTYNGWVNPDIITRYGLETDADTAWNSQGGGKFSFKIDKKAIPANLKSKGWSDAKAFSATMLRKNPNSYFYRHVAPHESQAQGEWSQEEHEMFLKVAKEHGVGDKWGLFASHIPQRVGYQCSAYYREVIIPSGLIIDPRWRMTRSGKAVYSSAAS